jgi:hypothetical protein
MCDLENDLHCAVCEHNEAEAYFAMEAQRAADDRGY